MIITDKGIRKINVLQAANGLGLGGIEKVLQLYTEHLSKDLFNISVCGLFEGGERGEFLKNQGFEVHILNGNVEKMIELMQTKKIDVLHIHQHADLNRVAVRAARAAKVSVVIETNEFGRIGEGSPDGSSDMNFMVSKMCALRYKFWKNYSWTDFFKRCDVLYNCIALSDFVEIDDSSKKLLREQYQIPDGFLVIGRHGRPDPSKWGDVCLEMMPYLIEAIPNVKYMALGIPECKIKKIKDMGLESYFIFRDPTKDFRKINEFLELLDVFTYSSVNGECLSLAIAEAMACGLPIVVNSTPLRDNGQVEMVDHNKNGFIANTPKAFAEAVALLLTDTDKRKTMGDAARCKVHENYEIKNNTKRLEKIYLEALSRKGMKIESGILESYKKYNTHPTPEEITSFEEEYSLRLRACIGRPNYKDIYLWEQFLCKYGWFKLGKKIKNLVKK